MINEDFAHLLKRIREAPMIDDSFLVPLLLNNLNTLMEALSVASKSEIKPRGPLDRDSA